MRLREAPARWGCLSGIRPGGTQADRAGLRRVVWRGTLWGGALAVLVLGGCGVVHRTFYIPVDTAYLREGLTCGWVPHGSAVIPLDDTVSISLGMAPGGLQATILYLQIPLAPGQSVQFAETALVLETAAGAATAHLQEFKVAVHGRSGQPGHYEYLAPNAVLDAHRNAELPVDDQPHARSDLFSSNVEFPISSAENVQLLLPRVIVNGRTVSPGRVEFRLVTRRGVEACVQ